MRKLLIFLMIAIPLVVIFIVNVTVDAVAGIVIIPVDSVSIVCDIDEAIYDDDNNLSQVNINDVSKTVKLSSNVYPESASNKEIYWESTNEDIAVVDSNGNVTFIGFGAVDIYAVSCDGTKKSSCLFVVTDTRVHEINIYADKIELEVGETTSVWARVIPSTSTNQDYTLTSSNTNVITINNAGVITAVSSGEATIIATADDDSIGYNCTASITIKVVKSVESVKLYPEEESLTLATNELRLRAIISPTDASNKNITYTTTDSSVATVSSDGVVKFLKAGEVTITVITQDGEFKDSINLIYTGGYPISLIVENSKIETNVSNGIVYKQIEYSFSPENPPLQNISFSSNNETVATVDKNGLIKILGGGNATITIKVQTSDDLYYFSYIEISSERKIDSITFPSNSITIASSSYTINAICNPSDATDTNNLSYSKISGDCANVSTLGVVTFTSAGQIIVEITDESPLQTSSVSATLTITYTGGYPSQVILDTENIEINVGQFNYLTFALYPIETSLREYYFEIYSQLSVCGLNNVISLDTATGKITGVSGGSAVVKIYVKTAEDQWISKSCTIIVKQNITKIELNCDEEVYEGKFISAQNIFNFTTATYPADATNTSVIYLLSDTSIASIVNNNQIYFNQAGMVTLTVCSSNNENIKATITLWYTGSCAVSADINGIPDTIVNGDNAFTVTLSNVIPANAVNKSFKINFTNQSVKNMLSVAYNETKTSATVSILNSGTATLSLILANPDSSSVTLAVKNITVLQKVSYISFPYSNQIISATQYNLQCDIYPITATQNEIIYSLAEKYQSIASIDGSILTFNSSSNASETVIVTATLTDIDRDGTVKTAQIEITTTFGVITSPEGNSISLSCGNSVEYDYSNQLSDSTSLNVVVKTGRDFISYILDSGKLNISGLSAGYSEIEVQLLNSSNEKIKIVANLEITTIVNIENITINSNYFTKISSRYISAQNDIPLTINLTPVTASKEGLTVSVSNSIATFDIDTGILHFTSAGIVEITIMSPDGSCSRSFVIQYTNGSSISYLLNLESDSNFYITQNYLVKLESYYPVNANLTVTEISEIILSGNSAGVEITNSDEGIMITFTKSGTVKLQVTLSDGNQKIISVNVTSSLSEIIFENGTILTASNKITLFPVLIPTSATDKAVVYTSSDTTVASVSSAGTVTFVKSGTVTITATSESNQNIYAVCQVTSTMGDVSEFTINYSNISFSTGETRNLIINSYLPTNATNTNFIYEIISSVTNDESSDPVISINGSVITCLKGGTATVKVYIINQSGVTIYQMCTVTVIRELSNLSITFNKTLDIYQNYYITSLSELDLFVNLTPTDATITSQSLTIDNENIAKIENGKLIFLTEGVVKITASYNLKTTTITVRYTKTAVSFEIDDSSSTAINGIRTINLTVGSTYTVKVKNIIPSDLTDKSVSLSLYLNSPNYSNSLVSSTVGNIITGLNGGYSTYKISVCGFTLTEQIKVKVIKLATSIETETNIITSNPSYPLVAEVLPYDTTETALTYRVLTSTNCVSVDSYGIVTFTAETTTTIEIKNTASGIIKIVTIKYDAGAKQITFENTINYVFIGGTLKLIAKITPYNVQNEEIEWSVSNESLATISSTGVLTPNKIEGVVTVTAKLKNYPEATATIKINIYANIYAIAFDLNNINDGNGEISGVRVFGMYSVIGTINSVVGDLTGCITNEYAINIKTLSHNSSATPVLVWTSSDESVAIVNNGVLTILKAGKVTITCTPSKQYYSDSSRYVSASYTFTFIEGINIDTSSNFSKWCRISASDSSYNVLKSTSNSSLSAETIAALTVSQSYCRLAGVLQKNIAIERTTNKVISKNLYGNGYKLDLQLNSIKDNETFIVGNGVTVNNVYFRGYTFASGEKSLSLLKDSSVLVKVINNSSNICSVTFKNCTIDGGKRCLVVENSNVTLSGCIIKNAYHGAITIGTSGKDKAPTNLTITNCIIENALLGAITNIANTDSCCKIPKITFNGNVYLFNWQDLSQYVNFELEGDASVANSYLADEIQFALKNYTSKFIVKDGIKYAHFGVLSPSFYVNIGVFKKSMIYDCEFINNSSITYGLDTYSNTVLVGSYSIKNYALNSSSTAILPGDSYMDDTLNYYKKIRDLT